VGQKAREKVIRAGDLAALEREVGRAKERFGLAQDARVVSCYEAGRDGFWLHRYLEESGVCNRVMDSSSLERTRRTR
jgi:transposase